MDFTKIRKKFPIFSHMEKKGQFCYIDSAATTQKPDQVIETIHDFYLHRNASVHRGVYELSEYATQAYEDTRVKVQGFINAADPSEIVITSGTTEGINFVADAWGMAHVKKGDEIVVTQAEHHANLLPWQRLAKRVGAKLRFIEIDTDSFLCKDLPDDLINPRTKLVSLVHVSNVLGNIWQEGQLEAIIQKAHNVGARVMLDGAQSVPHEVLDVQALGVDFVAFSAHKMAGPTGIGVLYIKKELHDEVEPYKVGGAMVHDASFEDAQWKEAPSKFEAGTPPVIQAVGLSATIDFFQEHVDFEALKKHENELCAQIVEELLKTERVNILGHKDQCGHLVAFNVSGIHAHDVAAMLGMNGVAIRAGHHCVQPLAKMFGIDSSVRASLYMYNNSKDVEIFVKEFHNVLKNF